MGTGMSMFNMFENGMACGPFYYGRDKMEKAHSDVNTAKDDDDNDNNGRNSDSDDEYSWVQSPSFRDYCVVQYDSDGSIKGTNNSGQYVLRINLVVFYQLFD